MTSDIKDVIIDYIITGKPITIEQLTEKINTSDIGRNNYIRLDTSEYKIVTTIQCNFISILQKYRVIGQDGPGCDAAFTTIISENLDHISKIPDYKTFIERCLRLRILSYDAEFFNEVSNNIISTTDTADLHIRHVRKKTTYGNGFIYA